MTLGVGWATSPSPIREEVPTLIIEQARLPGVRLLLAILFNPLTEWAWDPDKLGASGLG